MTTASTIRCVLFDLDGVIRHFDPARQAEIERRHGLEPGVLLATGMASPLIDRLVTGELTRAEWGAEIGRQVGAPEAARELIADQGNADQEVLAIIDELRARGLTVAILTNGTDEVPDELATLGIDRHIDALFNSAEMGIAKPDPAAFRHVCRALDLEPAEVFFTDDSTAKLAGAVEIGMLAETFTGADALRRQLGRLGLLP